MSTLGEKVALLRTSQGWTLQQLSDLTGISVSHLNAIEHGTRPNPSFQYVVRIAEAFRVSLAYFSDTQVHAPTSSSSSQHIAETRHTFIQPGSFDHFDATTQRFLADKRSVPYVAFARELAEQSPPDPVALLDMLTQFLKSQRDPV